MVQLSNTFCDLLFLQIILSYSLSYLIDANRSGIMTNAFVINPSHAYRYRPTSTALYHIQMSKPFPENEIILDLDRAQYCVNHSGTCTIAEMESLKNGFHAERMQNFVFGFQNGNSALERRLLEGELDVQISLIKEQNSITDVSIFPTDDTEDEILPNLHTSNIGDASDPYDNYNSHTIGIFHQPTPSDIYVLEETILEENLLEPIAICCAILGLAILPQLM